jgi:hypothetical protein
MVEIFRDEEEREGEREEKQNGERTFHLVGF